MYINKAIIYGNLTRDPELRSLPSGIQVATMSLATNRVWKNKDGAKQESVDYHNVVVFGRQAETAAQYLKKGSGVFVEGRMQTRSWDATDGTKKYRTEVVAEVHLLGDVVHHATWIGDAIKGANWSFDNFSTGETLRVYGIVFTNTIAQAPILDESAKQERIVRLLDRIG